VQEINRLTTVDLDKGFLSPLLHLRQMEQSHVPYNRRDFYCEPPRWLLFFKSAYYSKACDFIHMTICSMVAIESASVNAVQSFNQETGILTKHLFEYLRDVEDANKVMTFLASFRGFLNGEKKRMPRHISKDREAYETLKRVVKTDYTKRLIGEYNKDGGDGVLKTQDFVALFKMPLYALLETVFCSMTDEDAVSAIDEYRM